MHKPRLPGSYARACSEAIGLVGAQTIADACEISVSYVYQWADDENSRLPSVKHAETVDSLLKRSKGHTPLFGVYSHRLAGVDNAPTVVTLDNALMEAVTGLGYLAEAIRQAKAPTGPGGHRLTNCEKSEIADKVSMLERKIDQIKASLTDENVVPFAGAAE